MQLYFKTFTVKSLQYYAHFLLKQPIRISIVITLWQVRTTDVTHGGAATEEFTVRSLSIRQRYGAGLVQQTLNIINLKKTQVGDFCLYQLRSICKRTRCFSAKSLNFLSKNRNETGNNKIYFQLFLDDYDEFGLMQWQSSLAKYCGWLNFHGVAISVDSKVRFTNSSTNKIEIFCMN